MADSTLIEPMSRKIEPRLRWLARTARAGPLLAVVRVASDGYVPSCIALRTRLTPQIFTAFVQPDALARLEEDARVLSVSSGRPLRNG